MTTVIPLRSNSAAANHKKRVDPIHLHAQAENALAMALYYTRQSVSNVPGAMRKTVQALNALSALHCHQLPDGDNGTGAAA